MIDYKTSVGIILCTREYYKDNNDTIEAFNQAMASLMAINKSIEYLEAEITNGKYKTSYEEGREDGIRYAVNCLKKEFSKCMGELKDVES